MPLRSLYHFPLRTKESIWKGKHSLQSKGARGFSMAIVRAAATFDPGRWGEWSCASVVHVLETLVNAHKGGIAWGLWVPDF